MFLIDYFSFTIKHTQDNSKATFLDALEILNLKGYCKHFVDIGSRQRYKHCFKLGNISILTPHSARDDMGVYINITGQGCREFENMFGVQDDLIYHKPYEETQAVWKNLFKNLTYAVNNGFKVNVTRIDIAIDDFDGFLDIDKIYSKLNNGEFVSRFKTFSEIEKQEKKSRRGTLGRTIYVGSRQSNSYCKFYDKLIEQRQVNKDDELIIKKLESVTHWIRFELTLKDNYAISLCNMMLYSSDVDKDMKEYLNSCLRFVDITNTRIENCAMSEFWSSFIGSENKKKLTVARSNIVGYDKTYNWFVKSLTPSLFALLSTYVDSDDFINEIRSRGEKRLNSKHQLITQGLSFGKKYSNADVWNLSRACWEDISTDINNAFEEMVTLVENNNEYEEIYVDESFYTRGYETIYVGDDDTTTVDYKPYR